MQRSAFLPAPANDTQSLAGCMQPTQAGEQTERENTLKGSWGGWVGPFLLLYHFIHPSEGSQRWASAVLSIPFKGPSLASLSSCNMTLSDSVSHFSQFL